MDEDLGIATMKEAGLAPVTVVIPCFRSKLTITRAIDSVAKQTVRPAEVIIVDDASRDGTAEYLTKIAEDNAAGWVKVIELQENSGAATARNVGWNSAAQPFVAFLDADDTWHPKKIEQQYAFMAKHPEVVLCGHRHRQMPWRAPRTQSDHESALMDGCVAVTKWQMLLSNRFITPSVMVRKEISYRFREGKRYMEDHLLWLQVICDGAKVVRLNAELAFIHKAPFGESGLSARLWSMEKGDLDNYWCLAREKRLSFPAAVLLNIYSLLKFGRRLFLYGIVVFFQKGVPSPARR